MLLPLCRNPQADLLLQWFRSEPNRIKAFRIHEIAIRLENNYRRNRHMATFPDYM
jgi:hypothetical protein